jgi:WD40 repeat protein/serine/threonine protein kinase
MTGATHHRPAAGDVPTVELGRRIGRPRSEPPARVDAKVGAESTARDTDDTHGASALLAAGAAIRHYEVIRPLGQGGMGQVYLARDTRLGRLVAIKRLVGQDGAATDRLLVEAQATARCRHENIVVVYEVVEHEGEPCLVLEYVEGSSLRSLMDRSGPDAPQVGGTGVAPALELVIPVVRALVCAHEQGVVHRDLKPENVLLTHDGRVKVVDFGIAVRLGAEAAPALGPVDTDTSSTDGDRMEGTSLYMAPEQWLGDEIDHRTDLWAVGLLLFELCAGRHPLVLGDRDRPATVTDLDAPMPPLLSACPEAGALAAVVDRCLAKHKARRFGSARELLGALEALRSGRAALVDGASPFPGLSSFQEADAARFFGRDSDVASALQMLRSRPLLAVVGGSGAGKSSFVRAGLIPALRRAGEGWDALVVRPGPRPLAALAEVLARAADKPAPGVTSGSHVTALAAALRAEPGQLGVQLRARCRSRAGRLLLFVDQFEELYTLGVDAGQRATFLACLEGVADDASSPLRVVLAVRSDFLDRLAGQRALSTEVTRGLLVLSPLEREGLREALVRPVEDAGHRFEKSALVEHMLDALGDARSPLPLLQFAGARMWEARDRGRRLLTEASYAELGGFAGALSAHADAVLAGLSLAEKRLFRAILLRLVTPERTRAVVSLDELRGLGPPGAEGEEAVDAVVRQLVDSRLLTQQADGGHGARTLELVHESLIERWPRLGRWLDEGAQDAEFLARLRAAARQWEAGGEAGGLLWRDEAAADARAWFEHRRAERLAGVGLGEREDRFLRAVVSLGERARRRRRWAVIGLVAALSAFAVSGSYLAVRARDGEALARGEAIKARNAARMAAAREKQDDPTTVLAILRELEPPELPPGWAALADAALRGSVARVVITLPEEAWSAAWSPDGRSFATASIDGVVRVFRADGAGEPVLLLGPDAAANSVAWSPDGRAVVTTWADATVRVFRADGTGQPIVLRGHRDNISTASFSPDGTRIASSSADRTVRVWNADGTGQPIVLRGHREPVMSEAWSPDGTRIASGSVDRTVRVWNADGTGQPIVLRGSKRSITHLAWSPDGRRLATTSLEGKVRIVPVDGAGEAKLLGDHDAAVNAVAWSPDGERVVSASNDSTMRIDRIDGASPPVVLRGHEGAVLSAAFSPDGGQVLSTSMDRTVRVYAADGSWGPAVLRGHDELVSMVAFSPDGQHVASSSMDGTARVWKADGAGRPVVLRGHGDFVISAAFSPDGRRVATASLDRTARLWSADGTRSPRILRHDGAVLGVAFSPDGRQVATCSYDQSIRVWPAGGGAPRILRGHQSRVTSVSFSPDGRHLVSGSADKTARIWDLDSGVPVLVLRGHEDAVMDAAFSPDGRRVATASADKTARVWDTAEGSEVLLLRGHQHAVNGLAWSPDGQMVATGSTDQTVRLWRADATGEHLTLRGNSVISDVAFNPAGTRLVGAVGGEVWIWTDLEPPAAVDSPLLWDATSYCLPASRRVSLLNVSQTRAWADEQTCRRRVEAARRDDARGRLTSRGRAL